MLTGLVNLNLRSIPMAKHEDIIYAIELFHKNRPQKIFEEVNKSEVGGFAVIKYLCEAENEVTSADICKVLKISSARMAVLIKKLETRGIVTKENSKHDSRSKILKLTKKGIVLSEEFKANLYKSIEKVVDEFGIEELESLFRKLKKLKSILHENVPSNLEEFNG